MKKVHPTPRSKSENLRRMPHIFSKILELPFNHDADVSIEETSSNFRFTIIVSSNADVWADTIQIYPGISKVVIRGTGLHGSDLDTWRFRLPEGTRLDSVTAQYWDGEIVVTVPKERDDTGVFGPSEGTLVLVQ